MWIVAVAWVYVIGLVALTEPTVVAGIMTFLIYCVLPLSILFYLTGGKARRLRRASAEAQANRNRSATRDRDGDDGGSDRTDSSDGGGDGGGD